MLLSHYILEKAMTNFIKITHLIAFLQPSFFSPSSQFCSLSLIPSYWQSRCYMCKSGLLPLTSGVFKKWSRGGDIQKSPQEVMEVGPVLLPLDFFFGSYWEASERPSLASPASMLPVEREPAEQHLILKYCFSTHAEVGIYFTVDTQYPSIYPEDLDGALYKMPGFQVTAYFADASLSCLQYLGKDLSWETLRSA